MGGGGSGRVGVCASRGGGRGCGMRRSGVCGSCSARNRGVSGLVRARQTQRKGEGEGERNVRAHAGAVQEEEAAGGAVEVPSPPEEFDAKKFRRQLSSSDKYNRRAKNDEKVKELMETEGVGAVSAGGLISQMRESGYVHVRGDVTVKLADSYGFCWGVERAVQMAYEARKQFPEEKLHITNEIIHNPTVNQKLKEMDVNFIEAASPEDDKDFSNVEEGDVVILPAFGASVQEMKLLDERGVQIIDTTCPWVSKVWNAVDVHKRKNYTSVIHGKYAHEETVATASFASTYIIVKNESECQYLIEYILADDDTRAEMRDAFMKKFSKAVSKGFDPDLDLVAVGVANQTTMLKGETLSIGKMLEKCMMRKFGVENIKNHYMVLDTICDATQERQDAMFNLVKDDEAKIGTDVSNKSAIDVMLVVGGFNSSNTSHLQEIAEEKNIPSFWVDTADRLHADGSISHRTSWGELCDSKEWLPEGSFTLGVTSGASTPDKVVEDVLDAVFALREGSAR